MRSNITRACCWNFFVMIVATYAAGCTWFQNDVGTLGISGTPGFVVGKTEEDQILGVRIIGAFLTLRLTSR